MKSIRAFLEGKIRRSESADALTLEPSGAPHSELGPHEGTLRGPNGCLEFFEAGLVLLEGDVIRYTRLAAVRLEPEPEPPASIRHVLLVLDDGSMKRLATSPKGAVVVFGALRWIGHTRLARDLTGGGG